MMRTTARFIPYLVIVGTLIAALTSTSIAVAQKKTDGGAEQRRAEQLRKLSAQNQQLESEKATLAKEKEDAQAKVKLAEDKSKDVQGQSSRLSKELATIRIKSAEQDKTIQANTTEIQKLNALLTAEKETSKSQQTQIEQRVQTIASMTEANSKLTLQLRELNTLSGNQKDRNMAVTSELGNCAKNNVALVGLVDEVSERYRKKSCSDARSLIEPLVGFRRAEFERVAEEYRAKAGDERYVPPVIKP
jgi:chromosome segregation ATPase